MVARRDERIAQLAQGSDNRAGRLKTGDDAPQLVETLPLDLIDPDPDQPRRHFDAQALQELAESLRSVGQLQPIIVVRAGTRYRLHVGERRWRASRLAGLETIRALVRHTALEARATRIAQIVENEQRADLLTSELVEAVRALRAEGLKSVEIATALSKTPARISELAALAEAPPELGAIIDRIGLDLSYQLLRQWRSDAQATLDFLAHMPVEHISRVTIATIGTTTGGPAMADMSDMADRGSGQIAARTTEPKAPGPQRTMGEGASPRVRAAASRDSTIPVPGTEDDPMITGSLLVEHAEHGAGHVVFGIDVAPDHLAISFAGAPPIALHKDAIRLVRTVPSGVARG